MQSEFFSEAKNPNAQNDQDSSEHKRFELSYSETVVKNRLGKSSNMSLKLTKSTTTVNSNPQTNQSPKTIPKKKLKSFRKAFHLDEETDFEFKLLPYLVKIVKIVDNMLYYVVFAVCQLPLLILKILVPLFNLVKKSFLWLRLQLQKRPIRLPNLNLFRSLKPLILVLDLDETLVHCKKEKPDFECEELTVFGKEGKTERYFISKRPDLGHFIEELSKFYTLVVFTSSQQEYADSVIDHIDLRRRIKQRFYRKSCIRDVNGYVKDLRVTKLPLDRTIMVDNSRIAFKMNEENAIHIKPWLGIDESDNELEQLMIVLLGLIKEPGDIREAIKALKMNNENSEVASLYEEELNGY